MRASVQASPSIYTSFCGATHVGYCRQTLRKLGVISFASLSFFVFANNANAAASSFVLYDDVAVTEDGEQYVEASTTDVLEDGGTYSMDLQKPHRGYPRTNQPSFGTYGYLYFMNASGTRDLVAQVSADTDSEPFVFGRAGTYELDIYNIPPPVVSLNSTSWLQSVLDSLSILHIAYAQSPDEFFGTISFTITDKNARAACCSNVLFIPGIQGSILKKQGLLGTEDTLWPPTAYSNDVSQLALNPDGTSVKDIYVDGIINNFTVGPFHAAIYAPFSTYMDGLVASGTIAHWESLPYDWRLMPGDILNNGIKTKGGVVDIIAKIEALASSSDTGKVTIIAHSMGGLMGKAIIKKLQDEGKDDLIDSFVMVGSPQLGTPQAVASLLHGDDEGIPGGALSFLNDLSVKPEDARQSGQNMPSAYNLLPAEKYFDVVSDPVITFDASSTFTEGWRNLWGSTIDNYTDYVSFLTGNGVVREKPAMEDLSSPEVANANLVQKAKIFHEIYDSYVFPSHINVVQIAGWGRPTVKGVEYTTEHEKLDYNPIFTREGDKTVVYRSALSSSAKEDFFVNLFDYNDQKKTDFSHKDLLSVSSVQQIISSVVNDETIDNPQYVTTSEPAISDIEDQLMVSAHSPAVLSAHDASGDFTGIDTDTGEIVENIPGSSVNIFADSEYIFVPKNGEYDFIYKGTGNGSTTIQIESFAHDVTTPIVTYSDMPTTPKTTAQFSLQGTAPEATKINLDENGDGSVDTVVKADGTEISLGELFDELKTAVNDLHLSNKLRRKLLEGVKVLEKLSNIKHAKIQKIAVGVQVRLLQFDVEALQRLHKISHKEAQSVLDVLSNIKEKI